MLYQNLIKHIQSVHPQSIDLSLQRIKTVAKKMQLLKPNCPVITVGGTNGKGTMVATLEQLYRQAHYHTAVFSSPYILNHTELFRIDAQDITQQQLITALEAVERQRDHIQLTEYEFLMLAGLFLFKNAKPDIMLLEVGLGGRDDVTNCIDPDMAIITNIALDHCQWLGNNREQIGAIKAGIFRKHIPLIYAEPNPPASVINAANMLNTKLHVITDNAALFAVKQLQDKLPIATTTLPHRDTLILPGRFQLIKAPSLQIHDVAHNPAAANYLVKQLKQLNHQGPITAIFSMFNDKDIAGTTLPLKPLISEWHIAELTHSRTASLNKLENALQGANVITHSTITDAYHHALKKQQSNELLLCCGSFQVLKEIRLNAPLQIPHT